jgi:hypothetical protein
MLYFSCPAKDKKKKSFALQITGVQQCANKIGMCNSTAGKEGKKITTILQNGDGWGEIV